MSRGWNAQFMTQLGEHWNANIGWGHLYQYEDEDTYSYGYSPKDLATFAVYYDYAKVKAGLDGYYFFRRVNPNYPNGWPADDYAIFNMSASYAPTKNINIYAKVNNLFDKMYSELPTLFMQPAVPVTGIPCRAAASYLVCRLPSNLNFSSLIFFHTQLRCCHGSAAATSKKLIKNSSGMRSAFGAVFTCNSLDHTITI